MGRATWAFLYLDSFSATTRGDTSLRHSTCTRVFFAQSNAPQVEIAKFVLMLYSEVKGRLYMKIDETWKHGCGGWRSAGYVTSDANRQYTESDSDLKINAIKPTHMVNPCCNVSTLFPAR